MDRIYITLPVLLICKTGLLLLIKMVSYLAFSICLFRTLVNLLILFF